MLSLPFTTSTHTLLLLISFSFYHCVIFTDFSKPGNQKSGEKRNLFALYFQIGSKFMHFGILSITDSSEFTCILCSEHISVAYWQGLISCAFQSFHFDETKQKNIKTCICWALCSFGKVLHILVSWFMLKNQILTPKIIDCNSKALEIKAFDIFAIH